MRAGHYLLLEQSSHRSRQRYGSTAIRRKKAMGWNGLGFDVMSSGLKGAKLKKTSWVIGDNVKFLSSFIKYVEFQLVIYNYKQIIQPSS